MHNSAGGIKEYYFSNGGKLDLDTNTITSEGGLALEHAQAMEMAPNLLEIFNLPDMTIATGANTGVDPMTSAHMRNWMECVRNRHQPHADVMAGYNHSIATIMTNAAVRTGEHATFDPQNQEVMVGGKVFQY